MRPKKNADKAVFSLFEGLDESQHGLRGLYEGRLRSRAGDVEGLKRKWELLTGQPVPKRLRTDDFRPSPSTKPAAEAVKLPTAKPVAKPPVAKPATKEVAAKVVEAEPTFESINTKSYNDIRKELKKRGISCVGKKTELVERLLNAMKKERAREETLRKKEALGMAWNRAKEENKEDGTTEKVVEAEDVVMEEAVDETSVESVKENKATIAILAEKETSAIKAIDTKPSTAPKSALKPSKYALAKARAASPARAPSPAKFKLATKPEHKKASPAMEPRKLPPKEKISSESESSNSSTSMVSKASSAKPTSVAMQTTPSLKAASDTNTSATKGESKSIQLSETKKKMSAMKENRATKLAELREKLKKSNATVGSAAKPSSAKSAFPSTTSSEMTKSTIAKMREKAAAEKARTSHTTSQIVKPIKPPVVSYNATSSVPPFNSFHPKSSLPKPSPSKTQNSALKTNAFKQMMDPANKVPPKKAEEKPLSPMQTYELSDREDDSDSEDDSDDDSTDKPRKAIPDWAIKANLARALAKQFEEGPHKLDPDRIFGEVETCNLEQIFGDVKSKKRYHKRTSSGNWTKDHVTIAEKLAYKRTMGYNHN